jgi:hypothetical protein
MMVIRPANHGLGRRDGRLRQCDDTLTSGRALGWGEQVFSFEFGAARATKTKDDTINKLTR